MAKRLITITVDDDVYEIVEKMRDRDINRSKHINSLIRFSEKCNFIVPKNQVTTVKRDVLSRPEPMGADEIAEARRDQGLDDE